MRPAYLIRGYWLALAARSKAFFLLYFGHLANAIMRFAATEFNAICRVTAPDQS